MGTVSALFFQVTLDYSPFLKQAKQQQKCLSSSEELEQSLFGGQLLCFAMMSAHHLVSSMSSSADRSVALVGLEKKS